MNKHGQLTEGGAARWCENHNQKHGFLYSCPNYSLKVRNEIAKDVSQFKNDLQSEIKKVLKIALQDFYKLIKDEKSDFLFNPQIGTASQVIKRAQEFKLLKWKYQLKTNKRLKKGKNNYAIY